MIDIVDAATRSRMMAGIRGKNTKPEITVRQYLHSRGLRFRLHVANLPGKPDIVLPKYGAVIFVHGCFWHRHIGCKYAATPASNSAFWQHKLTGNTDRDFAVQLRLKELGWCVYVVWECEVRSGTYKSIVEQLQQ